MNFNFKVIYYLHGRCSEEELQMIEMILCTPLYTLQKIVFANVSEQGQPLIDGLQQYMFWVADSSATVGSIIHNPTHSSN